MVRGALPLPAAVSVFGFEKCPLKAPVPQGGRWNPELGHTHSQASVPVLLFTVCVGPCVHVHMPQHVCGQDNLQELGVSFHCMGPRLPAKPPCLPFALSVLSWVVLHRELLSCRVLSSSHAFIGDMLCKCCCVFPFPLVNFVCS